jgi:hypothetical protein
MGGLDGLAAHFQLVVEEAGNAPALRSECLFRVKNSAASAVNAYLKIAASLKSSSK